MSNKNLPGFVAEGSLCEMKGSYHLPTYPRFASNRQVLPQMNSEDLVDCYTKCNKYETYGEYIYCSGSCLSAYFSQGSSEGGVRFGGPKPCRPRCGSCRPTPSEGPGLWKFCITRDCDGDFYPC